MATAKPQTISYPAPDARPRRHDSDPLDPHVIVLFGATGDLAKRKLIPGLAYLDQSELAPNIEIVATSLEDITDDEFRELAKEAIDDLRNAQAHAPTSGRNFAEDVTYVPQSAGPEALAAAVAEAEAKLGPNVRRLHYLSVPPKAARAVITMLRDANLVDRSRVVMEKPFGTDLASAVALNDFVHETFEESQIFRIDHFLGKEAAQNILAFRFANGLFEPIWNRNFIDHIQIDIPESSGPRRAGQLLREHRRLQGHGGHPPVPGDGVRGDGAADGAGAARHQRGEEQGVPVDAAGQVRRMWFAASSPDTATKPKAWQGIPTPRRSSRSRSASTTGAGPACRSTCAPARRWPRASASSRSPSRRRRARCSRRAPGWAPKVPTT